VRNGQQKNATRAPNRLPANFSVYNAIKYRKLIRVGKHLCRFNKFNSVFS